MRQILCFDFDGTLVEHGGDPEFHPELRERIRAFRAKGALFVINTGRTLRETIQGIGSHGLLIVPDFIVAAERDIYVEKGGQWKDFGKWNKVARKVHEKFLTEHKRFFAHLTNQLKLYTKARFLRDDSGDTGIVSATSEEMDGIVTYLEQHLARLPGLGWQRNGIYLRFMHRDHNKGSALRELAQQVGASPSTIFAAGDNFNDLSMLQTSVARHIACPSNSIPEVLDHVRNQGGFLASRPASQGMIEALDHFFAKKDGITSPES
jgi:HAD superfamily hydrolase (TIGR01484 family)